MQVYEKVWERELIKVQLSNSTQVEVAIMLLVWSFVSKIRNPNSVGIFFFFMQSFINLFGNEGFPNRF